MTNLYPDWDGELGSFQGFRFTEVPNPATWRARFWRDWLRDMDESDRRPYDWARDGE